MSSVEELAELQQKFAKLREREENAVTEHQTRINDRNERMHEAIAEQALRIEVLRQVDPVRVDKELDKIYVEHDPWYHCSSDWPRWEISSLVPFRVKRIPKGIWRGVAGVFLFGLLATGMSVLIAGAGTAILGGLFDLKIDSDAAATIAGKGVALLTVTTAAVVVIANNFRRFVPFKAEELPYEVLQKIKNSMYHAELKLTYEPDYQQYAENFLSETERRAAHGLSPLYQPVPQPPTRLELVGGYGLMEVPPEDPAHWPPKRGMGGPKMC